MYRIFNTAKTDLSIPVIHTKKRAGATGIEGSLCRKVIVPGTAKGEETNFAVINEMQLRSIFGLYKMLSPGVMDKSNPTNILIQNVTKNKTLLDSGKVVVVDENGKHVLGMGTKEYQSKVVETTMKENQDLKDQVTNFIAVLVNEGLSEDDAKKIVEGQMDIQEAKIKANAPLRNSPGRGRKKKSDSNEEKSDDSEPTKTEPNPMLSE